MAINEKLISEENKKNENKKRVKNLFQKACVQEKPQKQIERIQTKKRNWTAACTYWCEYEIDIWPFGLFDLDEYLIELIIDLTYFCPIMLPLEIEFMSGLIYGLIACELSHDGICVEPGETTLLDNRFASLSSSVCK